ncbi:MAG: hypothetical protein IJI67_01680 [Clostridia bacterium]|nr:hypothetical protein [Clostridia bacterium]
MLTTKEKVNTALLASFATLKGLADENKYDNSYQILREFMKYIVTSESLHSFLAVEMKNYLDDYFGFQIPEAVVKTTAKNTNWLRMDNGSFFVDSSQLKVNPIFQEEKNKADAYSENIIIELSEYIKNRTESDSIDKDCLLRELVCFLIDDSLNSSNKYTNYISEFILKNEENYGILKGLDKIREGSVLFIGLSNNISEIGSITKTLNLYLGTEILFSLVGYNGTIHQQFARDFIDQVRVANSGGKRKVKLYYFSEVKREVDEFFASAGEIVKGNKQDLVIKVAMKEIVNGCASVSDVTIKQADFFTRLNREFGIVEDPNDFYYDEDYFTTNLEYVDDEDEESEEDVKRKKEASLRLISHINKLRNGKTYEDELDSEHLIIANSKMTLMISKEQSKKIKEENELDKVCNFAIHLNQITNLLWYKLGSCFSQREYPTSVSALLKARVVLSSRVAKNSYIVFNENQQKYVNGEITEEQLAARILSLRDKPKTPEELRGDDIVDTMDFSPEFLSRYEEEHKNNQKTVKEQQELIKTIQADKEKSLLEKDEELASKNAIIEEKDAQISAVQDTLEYYRRKEQEEEDKKTRRKNIRRFIWSILWKVLIIGGVTAGAIILEKILNISFISIIALVFDIVGVIFTVVIALKKDKEKYLGSNSKKS